jgi:hypothetical protein
MPFLKDEEGEACGRKGKILQEEQQHVQKQKIGGMNSFGQARAEGKCEKNRARKVEELF